MKYAILMLMAGVLAGCPTITTVDTSAAVDLYEERLQWRVDLKAQIDGWREEKVALEAAPAGSSGPNPRIVELARLIDNALALLNEDDRLVTDVVRESMQMAFREMFGQDVTLVFRASSPNNTSTRPGAVAPE